MDPPPSDNIWAGDLPVGTDQGALEAIFSNYGTVVQCRMLPTKAPGAKPCAMVRFESVEQAEWVVSNLNGNIPEGCEEPVLCRFANAKGAADGGYGAAGKGGWASPGPYGGGKAKGKGKGKPAMAAISFAPKGKAAAKGGDEPPPSDNVWVGELYEGIDEDALNQLFSAYGEVVQCKVLPGKDSAKPAAMVRFADVDQAAWVVENLNGNIPDGMDTPIKVRFANDKSAAGGGWAAPSKGAGKSWTPPGKGAPAVKPVMTKPVMATISAKGFGAAKGGGGKGGKGNSFYSFYKNLKEQGTLGPYSPPDAEVYVKNLPNDTDEVGLYKLFSPFGAIGIGCVKIMTDFNGTCNGTGFVNFADPEAAANAINTMNGQQLPNGEELHCSLKVSKKGAGK